MITLLLIFFGPHMFIPGFDVVCGMWYVVSWFMWYVLSLINNNDIFLYFLDLKFNWDLQARNQEFWSADEGGFLKWSISINIWDKVFKNGPSKVCERQPLKILKWYGLLRQICPILYTIHWRKGNQKKILEFFIRGAPNTAFQIRHLTHRWTLLCYFLLNSGHFFSIF